MLEADILKSIPIGSILDHPTSEDDWFLEQTEKLPPRLLALISSAHTGAFIRGLTKAHNVALDKSPLIAFAVLRIACGEKTIAQLPSLLSTELQLANDQAQKMAVEIEKELFAPIMLEYNQYLAQQKKVPGSPITTQPQASGARNVLDLKNQPRPPIPPAIPRR